MHKKYGEFETDGIYMSSATCRGLEVKETGEETLKETF